MENRYVVKVYLEDNSDKAEMEVSTNDSEFVPLPSKGGNREEAMVLFLRYLISLKKNREKNNNELLFYNS